MYAIYLSWHSSYFTVTTLHNSPTNVTNRTCHDDPQTSRFALHVIRLFFKSVMLHHARSAQIPGNPKFWDQVWPVVSGISYHIICIFICDFSVWNLLYGFVIAPVFFIWLRNFSNTCTYIMLHLNDVNPDHYVMNSPKTAGIPKLISDCFTFHYIIFLYKFRKLL